MGSVNVIYFCFGAGHCDNKSKLERGRKQVTKSHILNSIYNEEGADGSTRTEDGILTLIREITKSVLAKIIILSVNIHI